MTQRSTPEAAGATSNQPPPRQPYLNFTNKTDEKGRGRKIIKGN